MKKKIVTILLASTMILSLLSGCGKEADSNTNTEESTESETGEVLGERVNFMELDASEYIDQINFGELVDLSDIEPITEEELKTIVVGYLESYPVYKDSDETLVLEDSVVSIDYTGYINDVAFEGGAAENDTIDIADSGFIEGFAEALIGHEVGETFKFDITFPEEYTNEYYDEKSGEYVSLSGVDAVFEVTINKIYGERVFKYEEMNDEYVAQLTGGYYTTLEEFLQGESDFYFNNKVSDRAIEMWDTIVANFRVKKGAEDKLDALIAKERKYIDDYYTVMSDYYEYEDFTIFVQEMFGYETLDDFNRYVDSEADYVVKQNLIVNYVISKNNLWLSDDVYVARANEVAQEYGYESYEAFTQDYDPNEVTEYIYYNIASEFIASACGLQENQ